MTDPEIAIASLAEHRQAAGILFEDIAQTAPLFHPHPLTAGFAETFQWRLDVHVLVVLRPPDTDPLAVAYGLLRGWDDGYEIPSLGLAVSSAHRGLGFGRLMMEYLHVVARLRGSPAIRLKVYPENVAARRLYVSLGYGWENNREQGQLVGLRRFR